MVTGARRAPARAGLPGGSTAVARPDPGTGDGGAHTPDAPAAPGPSAVETNSAPAPVKATPGDGGRGEDTSKAPHQPLALPMPGRRRRRRSLHVAVVTFHGVGNLSGTGGATGDIVVPTTIVTLTGVIVLGTRIDGAPDVGRRAPLLGSGPGRSTRARGMPPLGAEPGPRHRRRPGAGEPPT